MAAVDAVIRARLTSEVALIGKIADYIIDAGGKRLRPVLLLLAAGALGFLGGGLVFHLLGKPFRRRRRAEANSLQG